MKRKIEREYKYLPALISLVAGLVISIVMIFNPSRTILSIIIILSVLLGFYIIGLIFRAILVKFKTKEKPKVADASAENDLEDVQTETVEEQG